MAEGRLGGVEIALYALCWAAPLLIGAAHPPVQVGLAAAALLLLVALGLGRGNKGIRVTPLAWVMLAALAYTALQLLPLPPWLLAALSPRAAELRAETGAGWAPITLDVSATAIELCKQLGYLATLLVAGELLRTREATRRAATVLALFGVAMAALTAGHRALHVTRLFGVYELRDWPGMPFFVPFVNPNHAASMLAISALSAFGLGAASARGARFAWLGAGAISSATLLMTTSRGGAIALGLGGFVLIGMLASAQFGRVRGILLSIGIVVVLGAGAWLLADGLRTRFVTHNAGESNLSNQKTRGWASAAQLAKSYLLVGVGRGAFEAPNAAFRIDEEGGRQVYAEDVVLQAAAEWGTPVTLGLFAWALVLLFRALRRVALDPTLAGLVCALVAVSAHGLVDCAFEYPGVMLPFVLALGAVVSRAETEERGRRRPRARAKGIVFVGAGLVGAGLVALGLASLDRLWWTESKRLRAALDARKPPSVAELRAILARHPAAAELEVLAGEASLRRPDANALAHLGRAMRLQPSSNFPHHLAAIELARLGRQGQAAIELRLAIERGARIDDAALVRLSGRHAIDAAPQTAEALVRLGRYLATLQRWDESEEAFRRASALDPGPVPRTAHLAALANAPVARRIAVAEAVAAAARSGDELGVAIHELAALQQLERADALFTAGREQYKGSAVLLVEGARVRAARGDLDGARRLLIKTGELDARGRLLVGELAVELADRAGDPDAAAAARARLGLLRAKADLDQPTLGETK